jgi:hypothetical protein
MIYIPTPPLPPLAGGVYTIDSVGGDFANPADASVRINQTGITGDVTFNIASGTYNNSPIGVLSDLGYKVTFQKDPNTSGPVEINYYINNLEESSIPSKASNQTQNSINQFPPAVVSLQDASNVEFIDLDLICTGVSSYSGLAGADVFFINNSDSILVKGCSLTTIPIVSPTDEATHFVINSSNHIDLDDNTMTLGKYGVKEDAFQQCDRNIFIHNNTFVDQCFSMIWISNSLAANCLDYINNSRIEDNQFTYNLAPAIPFGGTDTNNRGAVIYSKNGTFVGGNGMSGFEGDGTEPASSLVSIDHDPGVDDDIQMSGNSIQNVTGLNGLTVTGVGSGTISSNTMSMTGTGGLIGSSGISVQSTGDNSNYLTISRNNMNMANANSITADVSNIKVTYNDINSSGNIASNSYTGINVIASSCFISTNKVSGDDLIGIRAEDADSQVNQSTGLNYYYNSVGVQSATLLACEVTLTNQATAGEITFQRNMVYNSGGGVACQGSGLGGPNWTADQNNYYSQDLFLLSGMEIHFQT